MIVAAHQPLFLPWLGFFDKMRKADLFIILDHVQFERQNYQNRAWIKTGQGPCLITVPVRQSSRDERITDKLVDNTGDGRHHWGHRICKTLTLAYRGAPHFNEFAEPALKILDARWERLIDLNLKLIDFCREALGIRTPVLRSSEMKLTGSKSDLVLELCRAAGAGVYLSGNGGSREYLDGAAFERAGVRIAWQDFVHPRYPQRPTPDTFIEKLSAIDLLVNAGPDSWAVLESRTAVPVTAAAANSGTLIR